MMSHSNLQLESIDHPMTLQFQISDLRIKLQIKSIQISLKIEAHKSKKNKQNKLEVQR